MANIRKIEGKNGISYKITVSAGRDINDKQIRHYMTYVPEKGMTERQIEKELNKVAVEFEKSIEQGITLDSNIKFADYANKWLEINKNNFAPITYTRYKNLLLRINQAIGHIRLGKLQPIHLQEFYSNLGEVISEKTNAPLSPQTIKHYHRCISSILAQATKERIIPRNIASREFMDAPRVAKKEPMHLNGEQAKHFVALLMAESDIRIKSALLLLLYSGCRIGELTGLEWADCDFTKHIINVKRSSQYCKDYGIITKEPKNNTSKRTIKLPEDIFTILSDYRRWYLAQRIAYGDRWENSDRLFIQDDGKPITPTTINKWLNKFIIKHSLPKITPHSLRHTNITLLIANGVDIRTVASKAGHSRTSTTLDIYAHAVQSADEMATQVLDAALSPKKIKVQ